MKITTIQIEDEQADWIEYNSINFSDWVRKKLEEAMKKEGDKIGMCDCKQ